MKIKIGDKIYDADKEPIMLIMTAQDRLNIIGMPPNSNYFCVYPEILTKDEIDAFMKVEENPVSNEPILQ